MKLDGRTRVFGLFGDPVVHSLSPAMQNAGFQAIGFNGCYLPFKVAPEKLTSAVQAILSLGISGVNVTAPHKENIISLLYELSEEAALLGAVNTIRNENNRLLGYNTDVAGFSFLVQNNVQKKHEKEHVVLLGAGGAAKAAALSLAGFRLERLVIANRTVQKAEKLIEQLVELNYLSWGQALAIPLEKEVLRTHFHHSTMIINALSSDPYELDYLPKQNLLPGCHAIDLRYNPMITPFMDWARESGAVGINGLDMLLGQGVKAFELFTSQDAPVFAMKKALKNNLD